MFERRQSSNRVRRASSRLICCAKGRCGFFTPKYPDTLDGRVIVPYRERIGAFVNGAYFYVTSRIHKLAPSLVSGELSFPQYWKLTLAEWKRLADYAQRRWAGPVSVAREDVLQEMAIAVFRKFPKWESVRANGVQGAPPGRFLVWEAVTAAKRWLHKQRGVRGDAEPSRHDLPFSSLSRDDRASARKFDRTEEPGQEISLEIEERWGIFLGELVRAEGDIATAAKSISKRCGVGFERARRGLEQAIENAEEFQRP